jgi:uncharacterized coiled-coil protein SlyX
MSHLTGLAQTAKTTLNDREVFVVDLSSELVEKDLQIEQMGTRTRELEDQVEFRDNTIEVLENQLHDLHVELDETNAHLRCINKRCIRAWRWMKTARRRRTPRRSSRHLVWTPLTLEDPLHQSLAQPLLLINQLGQ